jgi:SAM-dependent methyltransferase
LLLGDVLDAAFDELLPPSARAKSVQHWSPLVVARRAALRFEEQGVRRILDVGCGPGKFCVAAAFAFPKLEFCGVDRDPSLVETGRELAKYLALPNVEFRVGDILGISWLEFDGFYFFNPFEHSPSCTGEVARKKWAASELLRVTQRLASAPVGATVVSYHGVGGPIPSSYDLASEEPVGSGPLRTWIKNRPREAPWHYLDEEPGVSRIPNEYLDQRLRAREAMLAT